MAGELLDRLAKWAEQRREDALMRRFGGIQRCPWCRQWAQTRGDWRFEPHDADPSLDRLTCGVCGGTSLWLWGLGFHFIRALDPPMPEGPDHKPAQHQGGTDG